MSVCEVVSVPHGDCDAFTVVCVACEYGERVLRCEGDDNAGVGDGGGVVVVSTWHEYVGGKHCSCIVSITAVVLWSVVRGMRGPGGVCEMFMCLDLYEVMG